MTKKVNSKRFPEMEFELIEKINEEERTIYLVRHTDLMDAVLNRLPKGYNCKYDFGQIQVLGNMHFMVKAILEDNEIRIVEYGECTPATLTTQIAKEYPATMAMNRAFDRAAIRYFNLGKKVYSDNEIDQATMKDAPTENTKQKKKEPTTLPPQPDMKTKAPVVDSAASPGKKEQGFADVDTTQVTEPVPAHSPAPEKGNSPDRISQLAKIKIGFLKYAEMTFEEVLKKDAAHMKWIAKEVTKGVNVKQADLIREYLSLKGIAF